MELKGRVKLINPRQDVSDKFSKREIVITTDEQFPQHILIEFNQDKCDLLDKYVVGEPVKIAVNVRGREWVNPQGEAKYFNTLQGWRIDSEGAAATQPQQPSAPPQAAPAAAPQRKYVHTDAAVPETAYIAAKWTHDQLVSNGKGRWEQPAAPAAPSAPAAPPAAPSGHNNDVPF